MSDSRFRRGFGQFGRRKAVESHLMKEGVLALVLLEDVSGVQIDPAELLEDVPEVTRWKLRVVSVVKFGFMTAVLAKVAPSLYPLASDGRVRQTTGGTIGIVTSHLD